MAIMRRLVLVAAAAAAVCVSVALTSCSSSKTSTTTNSSPATTSASTPATSAASSSSGAGGSGSGQTAKITISGFAYSGDLTVTPGEKVTVTDKDSVSHTLTGKTGNFDTGPIGGSGGTGSFTAPTQPGSYALTCSFHPNMHGTLTVKS
jgi:plastocyanin